MATSISLQLENHINLEDFNAENGGPVGSINKDSCIHDYFTSFKAMEEYIATASTTREFCLDVLAFKKKMDASNMDHVFFWRQMNAIMDVLDRHNYHVKEALFVTQVPPLLQQFQSAISIWYIPKNDFISLYLKRVSSLNVNAQLSFLMVASLVYTATVNLLEEDYPTIRKQEEQRHKETSLAELIFLETKLSGKWTTSFSRLQTVCNICDPLSILVVKMTLSIQRAVCTQDTKPIEGVLSVDYSDGFYVASIWIHYYTRSGEKKFYKVFRSANSIEAAIESVVETSIKNVKNLLPKMRFGSKSDGLNALHPATSSSSSSSTAAVGQSSMEGFLGKNVSTDLHSTSNLAKSRSTTSLALLNSSETALRNATKMRSGNEVASVKTSDAATDALAAERSTQRCSTSTAKKQDKEATETGFVKEFRGGKKLKEFLLKKSMDSNVESPTHSTIKKESVAASSNLTTTETTAKASTKRRSIFTNASEKREVSVALRASGLPDSMPASTPHASLSTVDATAHQKKASTHAATAPRLPRPAISPPFPKPSLDNLPRFEKPLIDVLSTGSNGRKRKSKQRQRTKTSHRKPGVASVLPNASSSSGGTVEASPTNAPGRNAVDASFLLASWPSHKEANAPAAPPAPLASSDVTPVSSPWSASRERAAEGVEASRIRPQVAVQAGKENGISKTGTEGNSAVYLEELEETQFVKPLNHRVSVSDISEDSSKFTSALNDLDNALHLKYPKNNGESASSPLNYSLLENPEQLHLRNVLKRWTAKKLRYTINLDDVLLNIQYLSSKEAHLQDLIHRVSSECASLKKQQEILEEHIDHCKVKIDRAHKKT